MEKSSIVQLSLEVSEDIDENAQAIELIMDDNGQYHLRTTDQDGIVTSRVVKLSQTEDGQILTPLVTTKEPSPCTSSIQTEIEKSIESKIIYLDSLDQSSQVKKETISDISSNNMPFYVMVSQDGVVSTSNQPNSYKKKIERVQNNKVTREDYKKATHNEVEKRRRDMINRWVLQLGKIVPDCANENAKQMESKSNILSKTCDYIHELQQRNKLLTESSNMLNLNEQEIELIKQQIEQIKMENNEIRNQITRNNGLVLSSDIISL